jgi:short subunit dehydrogenase-like uncharacterized protein
MSSRVILFGATGYTGQLTAEAMARRGMSDVVLAGRDARRLTTLAATLAEAHGWDCLVAQADSTDPQSVRALVRSPDDVLVTTVGPFTKYGLAAIDTATSAGAVYIDSTGEPPFIRRVFEYYGPRAERTGASLLTAFGYDYVPGNLAGLLALRRARDSGFTPTRVDVGYFVAMQGHAARTISGGTAASSLAILTESGFAWHDGAIQTERPAAHVRAFDVGGKTLDAISLGGTEHFTLPRLDPSLNDVRVFLGWAGKRSSTVAQAGRLLHPLRKVPFAPAIAAGLGGLFVQGSSGGPSPADRAVADTVVVAEAFAGERRVSRVQVQGPGPYDLTADLLAFAADTARRGGLGTGTSRRAGALGPADAFGADEFIRGCEHLGLAEIV